MSVPRRMAFAFRLLPFVFVVFARTPSSLENVLRLQGPPQLEQELVPKSYEFSPQFQSDLGLFVPTFDREFVVGDGAPSWATLSFEPEVVIGLTSIFRSSGGGDYLFMTVSRLFGSSASLDVSRIVVVVALTDIENIGWVIETRLRLITAFPQFYENGNLHIIVPPRRLYPHPKFHIKKKYSDTVDRTRWRTKQNYDVAFLMMYCSFSRAKWFLMIEDDIASGPLFVTRVLSYVANRRPDFIHAQFTYLGLIGKLFPMKLVLAFAKLLFAFAEEMPVDWLIWAFLDLVQPHPITPRVIVEKIHTPEEATFHHRLVKHFSLFGHWLPFVPKCNVEYEVINEPGLTVESIPMSHFTQRLSGSLSDVPSLLSSTGREIAAKYLDDRPYLSQGCTTSIHRVQLGCQGFGQLGCKLFKIKLKKPKTTITGITVVFDKPFGADTHVYGSNREEDCQPGSTAVHGPKNGFCLQLVSSPKIWDHGVSRISFQSHF